MKALAGAALVAALGTDALAQADPSEAMPTAIGRISYGESHSPGAAICTGTLVAPDLVLTAAHCVTGAAAHPSTIRFSAGLQDDKALAEARGSVITSAKGAGIAADVALVRLDRALPAGVVPLRTGPETGPRLTRFAYRRDRPDAPERADLCLILEQDGPFVLVGCPAVSGNSGAALLSWDGNGWRVVAVTIAQQTGGFGAVAVRVPSDLADIIGSESD